MAAVLSLLLNIFVLFVRRLSTARWSLSCVYLYVVYVYSQMRRLRAAKENWSAPATSLRIDHVCNFVLSRPMCLLKCYCFLLALILLLDKISPNS